jgi:hypothetical protein
MRGSMGENNPCLETIRKENNFYYDVAPNITS